MSDAPTLISIGILAWNEELTIDRTLVSLLKQSVFQDCRDSPSSFAWEIIVVPNGCSDRTAEVAQKILSEHVTAQRGNISWAIRELTEAGKSNAWNHFVHTFSDHRAKLIVMMDADIEFGSLETMSNTVDALLSNPQAVVAVDTPLKDALKKRKRSLVERISVTASAVEAAKTPSLSGQFFCARTSALRSIWMPKGLSVEDGFLGAMLCSDCMRVAHDSRKLIRSENASHYYATLTSLKEIFRHELRLVIGTALNCYFIWDFLLFATDPQGAGAGELIRNQLDRDQNWYAKLISNSIRNRGWWVLPNGMLFRRFSGYSNSHGTRRFKWLLLAVTGFLLDLPIFLYANRRLKKDSSIGYW